MFPPGLVIQEEGGGKAQALGQVGVQDVPRNHPVIDRAVDGVALGSQAGAVEGCVPHNLRVGGGKGGSDERLGALVHLDAEGTATAWGKANAGDGTCGFPVHCILIPCLVGGLDVKGNGGLGVLALDGHPSSGCLGGGVEDIGRGLPVVPLSTNTHGQLQVMDEHRLEVGVPAQDVAGVHRRKE